MPRKTVAIRRPRGVPPRAIARPRLGALSLFAGLPLFGPLPGLAVAPAAAQAPRSEIPDPCALLTRADAAELMGEAVERGRSYPTSPWNCVYRARGSDGLLTLTLELGQGTEVASTRGGMELAGCDAAVVSDPDEPGERARLYHTPDGRCGEAWTLWVATGVPFRGRTSERFARETEGVFHITVVRYPPGGRETAEPLLRQAAERVLGRLRGIDEGEGGPISLGRPAPDFASLLPDRRNARSSRVVNLMAAGGTDMTRSRGSGSRDRARGRLRRRTGATR